MRGRDGRARAQCGAMGGTPGARGAERWGGGHFAWGEAVCMAAACALGGASAFAAGGAGGAGAEHLGFSKESHLTPPIGTL